MEVLMTLWIVSIVVAFCGAYIAKNHSYSLGAKVAIVGIISMWGFNIAMCNTEELTTQESINKKQQEIEVLQIKLKYKENK